MDQWLPSSRVPFAVVLVWFGYPLLQHRSAYTVYGPFDVRPLDLLGIGLVAVLAGLAAAAIPARTAARLDPVRALAGRRGQASSPRRWPFIGLALAVLGAALSVAAAARVLALYRSATEPELGRRCGRHDAPGWSGVRPDRAHHRDAGDPRGGRSPRALLPLSPRLALRDASRNRGRAAPAVGAVLAAVAVSSALTLYVASQDDHDRRHYVASLQPGQGQVGLRTNSADTGPASLAVAPIRSALTSTLPIRSISVVRTLTCGQNQTCVEPTFRVPTANLCPEGPTRDGHG